MEPKRIYRSRNQHYIGGVCQGIAEYFAIDPTIVRLVWGFAFLWWGTGLLAYLLAWWIIPIEQ